MTTVIDSYIYSIGMLLRIITVLRNAETHSAKVYFSGLVVRSIDRLCLSNPNSLKTQTNEYIANSVNLLQSACFVGRARIKIANVKYLATI